MKTNDADPTAILALADLDQRRPQLQLGFSALQAWLRDVARQGLGTWQTQPESAWEAIATQLSDAKLPELAKRLRRLFQLRHQPNWLARATAELGELYLLLQAFQKMTHLPVALQAEVVVQGGRLIPEKNLLASGPFFHDHWHLLALRQGVEEKLRFQRAWLWGANLRRLALVLDFAWQDAPFKRNWAQHSVYEGKLCFYPGSYPLRATPQLLEPVDVFHPIIAPFATWEQCSQAQAQALAQQPWLTVFPVLIKEVHPLLHDGNIYLQDNLGQAVPLPIQAISSWQTLAYCPGTPVTVFGEWAEGQFTPLALIENQRILRLED